MRLHRLLHRAAAAMIAALLVLAPVEQASAAETATAAQAPTLVVSYLNVGQGDAAVIQCGGQTMMIDGGAPSASQYVYSWLQNHGITHIDYMIGTHPDADHVGGLAAALQVATVDNAWCSSTAGDSRAFNSWVKYLNKQGKALAVPAAGTAFALGNAIVQIIGPLSVHEGDNDNSLVTKVTYGNTSFLFTGDAETAEENELIASGQDLSSTVIKIGHHGSDSSTSAAFLQAVHPQFAVISVGADNSYGHPTAGVLSRLQSAGITTYRTDMQGTITAISNGTAVAIVPEQNENANTYANPGSVQGGATASDSGQGAAKASVAGAIQNAPAATTTPSAGAVTYVLNSRSMKFHYATCKWASQISSRNRTDVDWSRDQVVAAGYKACKTCKP